MNTPNGNFIEKSIPNNNATITLKIAGVESEMKLTDFVNAISTVLQNSNLVVNTIKPTSGLILSTNTITDITADSEEVLLVNSRVIMNINGTQYAIAAEQI